MDSNLSAISVYWIDSNNMNKHNPLYLSPVALSDNNTRYTCFIRIHQNPNSCITQNKSITITIKSNEYCICFHRIGIVQFAFPSDTFVDTITIFPTIFIIGTPGTIACEIHLNTEIGPGISSLLVEWYHNNNSISNNTLSYTISSLTSNFTKQLSRILEISQVEARHSGKYACVASIGEENQKMSSEDICVNCM